MHLLSWRLVAVVLAVTAMICTTLDATGAAILGLLCACMALGRCGRIATGSYLNFTSIFLLFFLLYGLSGPIAAHFGEGLHAVFPRPYLTNDILMLTGMSLVGLAAGLWTSWRKGDDGNAVPGGPNLVSGDLYRLSLLFAALAAGMEVINTLRAGGIGTLVLGKATVQSAVAELTWTLPADLVLLLAAAFLGLALASPQATQAVRPANAWMRVLAWLIIASPSMAIYLALGRRLVLISAAIVIVVGACWNLLVTRLKWGFVLVAALIYVFMGAIFVARAQVGYGLATGDWQGLAQRVRTQEFWALSLNPATIEFGGTFGNVNTYLLSGGDPPLLGQTYAAGLTVEIPRSVWPSKPQSATYVFRDRHFPELAERGAIAGTAFSSLLEALMNFGMAGIVLIYAALGAAISWLERTRTRRSSALFFPLFYLLLLPEAMTIHRSAFDNPFAWPLLLAVVGTLSYLILRSLKTRIPEVRIA